ncbi:hypothetical protein OSTOST_17970, partial [Ostertagia ostertagi]
EDRIRQANHEIIRENSKRTGSGRILKQLRQKIYPIVRNPRKYGFKNICLLLLVLSYTLIGAAIFYMIESNYEHKTVAEHKAALDGTIEAIAKEMTQTINDPRRTVDEEFMIAYLQSSIMHLAISSRSLRRNLYANSSIRWRKFRSRKDVEDGEVFTLPVILCMLFMLLYLMGTTTFIFAYDRLSGTPSSVGIDYFYSFYFSFMTLLNDCLGD